MGPGEGDRARLHLPLGVSVWLCATHRSPEFLARRAGRDLVVSLRWAWDSAGCLTRVRERALEIHGRGLEASGSRTRPGSYSWPTLRVEAEARFGAGEDPTAVIRDLRASAAAGPAVLPSARTMRRWFTDGRWRGEGPSTPEVGEPQLASS